MAGVNGKATARQGQQRGVSKMVPSDQQSRLASKLFEWAHNEMKYIPTTTSSRTKKDLTSADNLKNLCRGQMFDIWEYIIAHVKHADTAKKIRGNLALKAANTGRSEGAVEKIKPVGALKKEHHLLQQTQSSVQTTTSHAEKTLHLLQNKVIDCAESLKQKKQQVKELQTKTAILRHMNTLIRRRIDDYYDNLDYINSLFSKINTVKEIEKNLKIKEQQQKESKYSTKIEHSCQEHVKKVCEVLELQLSDLMVDQNYADCKTALNYLKNEDKQVLWSLAWELLCSFPVRVILNTVLGLSSNALKNIQRDIDKINIEKDAEALQFQYESSTGNLVDVSKPPEMLKTVADILNDGHLAHLAVRMNTEKSRNNIHEFQKQLSDDLKILDSKLRELFDNEKNMITTAKGFVKSTIQMTSENASLDYLIKKHDELSIELDEIKRKFQEKEEKLEQIKNFHNIKESKQKLIRTLINQNVGIHEWMNKLRIGIQAFVRENLRGKYQHMSAAIESIWKCIPSQISALQKLPIVYLSPLLAHNWNSSHPLSIYCLEFPSLNPSNELHLLTQTVTELKFPHCKSPESLLQFILKAKVDTVKLKNDFQILPKDKIKLKNEEYLSFNQLNDLVSRVITVDKDQNENLLPMLKQSSEMTNEGFQLCNQITKDMECWWNQPAKNIPSSITIHNMTLQQCLDRWATASAMITQKSLNL